MTREAFIRSLEDLRESLLRLGSLVESQIDAAVVALKKLDRMASEQVRRDDQKLNEIYRQIREQSFTVIATQQPVARDLRTLLGIIYIAAELERMGDYAVRIARMTDTLCGLPNHGLRAEFGIMGQLVIQQVRDILDALIQQDEIRAREVAAKDEEIDRLYHRLFNELIEEMAEDTDADETLRGVTLMLVAHNLERVSDRVTNVAEDIIFLETGQVVELG